MGIGAILNGHLNEVLGLNTDVSDKRLVICKKCPLFKTTMFGPICNNKLWLNLKTGDISTKKMDGYVSGCGCRLQSKTRVINATCPIGKW